MLILPLIWQYKILLKSFTNINIWKTSKRPAFPWMAAERRDSSAITSLETNTCDKRNSQ